MPLQGATMNEKDAVVCSAGFSPPGVAEATTTNIAMNENSPHDGGDSEE